MLVAEDRLSDQKIADAVGVDRSTIIRWRDDAKFSARVRDIVGAFAQRAMKQGLARRERRLQVLADMHDRMLQVIDDRAKAPDLQGVPGGQTGIVCKQLKGIGKGDNFQVVEVYEVDTGTLKEIRETQQQIADELGQKVQKIQMNVTDSMEAKSDDDLRYWLTHKHWPDEPCVCPVPQIGESPSKSVQ